MPNSGQCGVQTPALCSSEQRSPGQIGVWVAEAEILVSRDRSFFPRPFSHTQAYSLFAMLASEGAPTPCLSTGRARGVSADDVVEDVRGITIKILQSL
jgi:hypothetical protein